MRAGIRDDGVAALQCCQRADGIERAHGTFEPFARDLQPSLYRDRKATLRNVQSLLQRCDATRRAAATEERFRVRQADASAFEPGTDRALQALFEFVEALRMLLQSCTRRQSVQRPFPLLQRLSQRRQLAAQALDQVALERTEGAQVFRAVRHAAFRRARGRRCALIRDEVGDRDVGLVAHAADDRNAASVDRARDGFLVERHQVFERAAAPGQDQHVALATCSRELQRLHDFARCRLALHRNGVDQDRHGREAALQDVQDVAQRSAGRRRNHADATGQGGQRLFLCGLEQALGQQLAFEFLEPATQRAFASLLEVIDDDLELATGLVEAHATSCEHPGAVLDREAHQHAAVAEHRAANLGRFVLQREIPVARGGARQVRDLAFEPD